jgi:hypothetical protein
MKITLLSLIVLLFSCSKPELPSKKTPGFTIKGQLFESRTNPVPVSDYSLTLGQNSNIGTLGIIGDLDSIKKTDKDGRFSFTYKSVNEYAVFMANQHFNGDFAYISLYGWDDSKGNYPSSDWLLFSALKNYNFDSLFLYKSIQTVVRKIQFKNTLPAGDSLEVITSNLHTAEYKNIYGPVHAGSFITVDTIKNLKITVFVFKNNTYMLRSALKKPGYQTDHDVNVGLNDEIYREIIMTY